MRSKNARWRTLWPPRNDRFSPGTDFVKPLLANEDESIYGRSRLFLHLWPVMMPYRPLAHLDATDGNGRRGCIPREGIELQSIGTFQKLILPDWPPNTSRLQIASFVLCRAI